MIVLINRLALVLRFALVLALTGALFLFVRDGGEAVSGNPEPLWQDGVERIDSMITADTQTTVENSLRGLMAYAERFGEDVGAIAD